MPNQKKRKPRIYTIGANRYLALTPAEPMNKREGLVQAAKIEFNMNEGRNCRGLYECTFGTDMHGESVPVKQPSLLIKLAPDVPEKFARADLLAALIV